MPGYEVATSTLSIGPDDYHLRSLADRCQYWDPDGLALRAGISPAAWPLFGVIWPAGIALAREMAELPVTGIRILEVGCGIGLASLVLKHRGADITACDHHPLAGEFLGHNAKLNGLDPIDFHAAPWAGPNPGLGRFDLIIGADLLYEPDHPALLAGFLALHATAAARVILADPGRSHRGAFCLNMRGQGYSTIERRLRFEGAGPPSPSRGRILNFDRLS